MNLQSYQNRLTVFDFIDCGRCPDELPNGYHDYGGYYCRSCSALAYMGSCEDYWYDLEHCFTDGTTMGIGGKVKDYCRCSCYNCGNDHYHNTSFFLGIDI